MAEQRLPTGQIQPSARPVDTFFSIGRPQLAAPAKPLEMPAVKGIQTVGTGGSGGFSTKNSFEQLSEALTPFSRELMKFGAAAGEMYAQTQYQEGLNEALKASRLLQGQVEQSAEGFAADNRKLARTDMPAALLMDSMNPYRRGGIEAGLAQTAASDVGAVFLNRYAQSRMELAGLEPGSPEVVKFQAGVQQEVMAKYGLNTSMPAVQKYFLSQANKAWEKVTELQWDDHQKLLKAQTPQLVTGEVTALLRNAQAGGVVTGYDQITGAPVAFSLKDPAQRAKARELLSVQTTAIFDKYAKRMGLPGEAVEQLQKAWEDLWSTSLGEEAVAGSRGRFVDNSLMREVLAGVSVGPPRKTADGILVRDVAGAVYGKSAVEDLLKYDSAAFEAKERNRKRLTQNYEADLAASTVGIPPGPELTAAIDEVNKRHPGLSAADKTAAAINVIPKVRELVTYGMDPAAPQQLLNDIDSAPLREFDPKAAAQQLNQMLPNVPDKDKESFLRDGQAIIRRKTEEKGKFDPLVQKSVDKAVIAELAERYPSSILEMSRSGKPVDVYALRSHSNSNLRQAAAQVESALIQSVQNALLVAQQQNPAMTAPQKQAVIDKAIQDFTSSKAFEKLFPGIGKNANADGSPSTATRKADDPANRTVYRGATYSTSQLRNLPDSTVKTFNQKPLLTGPSVRSELEAAAAGRGFSSDLKQAAKRAGVSPLQMLEAQLKFYPSIQIPKEMMDDIRRGQRVSSGRAAASKQVAFNPITGVQQSTNWLFNLLMPPAAAATMPPNFGGGYQRSSAARQSRAAWRSRDARGQSLIAMATRNGWDPADIAAIISFETGGTLNPSEPGRGAAAGRIGLIQAGPNERAAYGLGSGDWGKEMLGIERYLKARGAKPGMGLADLYATVNGGNPGAGYTPDGNGVVARDPSTIRALNRHRQQALNRLGMNRSTAATPLANYRSQVSSITYDGGQPGIDVFFENKRIPAVLSGRVKDIGFQGTADGRGYGHYIVIESVDPATGQKVDVLYAHLPARSGLQLGSTVRTGQVIGTQGGSGRVVSADGTIASIDFLAPRARGSKDMTPYRDWQRLRRRIAQQLGG